MIDQDTSSRSIVIEEKNSKLMQICSIMIHSAAAVPVAFNINDKVTARYIRSYFQVHGLLRLSEIPTDFSASKILQKKQKFKIRVLMFQITQWHEKLTHSSPLKWLSSDFVTSDSKTPSHYLTSTKPGKALQPKQSSNTSIFDLQLLPVLPQMLDIIKFLPEWLITTRNTVQNRTNKSNEVADV